MHLLCFNPFKDCDDSSDEKNCRMVSYDKEKYLKNKPPSPPKGMDKLPISVRYIFNILFSSLSVCLPSVDVKVIQEIKEIQQMLQLKFNLRMEWVDARLEFYNIKLDETMNVVTIEELERIWLPIIVFDNTESDQRSILDGKSFATIKRMNKGVGSDSTFSEDIDIYKGSENTITMSRLYNIEFFCDYDMRWYPFDAQTCFMDMKLGGGTDKLVSLIPGELKYLGPKELTQYYVKKYLIGETAFEDGKGLSVSITFGRRLLGTILTVYLPTVLLNVIGHATNFFKPFFFEASPLSLCSSSTTTLTEFYFRQW